MKLIETIQVFRMRYVVEGEVPETFDELTEFSQLFLGETVTSVREISNQEFTKLFDQDNPAAANWRAAQKRRVINER